MRADDRCLAMAQAIEKRVDTVGRIERQGGRGQIRQVGGLLKRRGGASASAERQRAGDERHERDRGEDILERQRRLERATHEHIHLENNILFRQGG